MEVRRLRPDEGAAKVIADTISRVKHLETRPAGTIFVDERIVARDPETGEETILGRLPDGSFGFQEFVNDTTPPGKPSTPKVTPAMGGLEVWWDGKEDGGTELPKDYLATVCEYQIEGTTEWKEGGTLRDANSIVVSNLVVGTKYNVRLISLDKNKNASEPSTIVSGVPVSYVDNEDVENALAELRDADRANETAAATAQEAAAAADVAAKAAGAKALEVLGVAQGKGRIIYATTAPTSAVDRDVNNLWIDTSGTVPKNTPHR